MDTPSPSSLPSCRAGARCRRWRTCATCAAIRQARIADAADRLAQCHPAIHWTRITPHRNHASEIPTVRARWRAAHPESSGLWTVEQGPLHHRLHLNLLHSGSLLAEIDGANSWTAAEITNHRRVASYISKRTQAPDPSQFHGRCFGTFGDLWTFMATNRRAPAIAAAALQFAVDPGASARAELDWLTGPQPMTPLNNHDFHRLAARWLPDIIDIPTSTNAP